MHAGAIYAMPYKESKCLQFGELAAKIVWKVKMTAQYFGELQV